MQHNPVTRFLSLTGVVLALLFGLAACGGESSDSNASGGSTPTPAVEPAAVFLGDPLAPRGVAIYVDGDSGDDDTGDGSRANPYASIHKALLAAADIDITPRQLARRAEVYVARRANGAAYAERPRLDRRRTLALRMESGVSLFGGYDPVTWTRNAGDRARVEGWSTTLVVADQIDGDIALAGFDIHADDSQLDNIAVSAMSSSPGSSTLAIDDCSINGGDSDIGFAVGLQVRNQYGLRLTNSTISAGRGGAGRDGTNITFPGADGADGEWGGDVDALTPTSQDWEEGGKGGSVADLASHHRGGDGGDGGNEEYSGPAVEAGHAGKTGGNGSPAGAGGTGGWIEANFPFDTHAPGIGGKGADGVDGLQGLGGNGIGVLSATNGRWFESSGEPGNAGQEGYGGGGGGGARAIGGGLLVLKEGSGGGGGGSGAEGGRPGTSGQGGHASIAVILEGITESLIENSELRSANGGDAGNGGTGSPGGTGGDGGGSAFQLGHLQGSAGGDGGDGGHGGGGGGGGGGPSIALLLGNSVTPVVRDNRLVTGDAGDGGLAGLSGRTRDSAAGQGGFSVGVYAIDTSNVPLMSGNQFSLGAAGSSPSAGRAGLSAQTNF